MPNDADVREDTRSPEQEMANETSAPAHEKELPGPERFASSSAPVNERPVEATRSEGAPAESGTAQGVEPGKEAEKPAEQLPRARSRRGFAAMDPELQRKIARRGGEAAHARGTAHEFTPEEAREAGRRGGRARRRTQGGGNTQSGGAK